MYHLFFFLKFLLIKSTKDHTNQNIYMIRQSSIYKHDTAITYYYEAEVFHRVVTRYVITVDSRYNKTFGPSEITPPYLNPVTPGLQSNKI